ncbi:hypothetical protein PMKS-000208 [Pichia membranifaciens]|uniref:FAD-binding FR-type domain-containing protein n=1 Tax=Pichia membranifaciens TaxID=4926 RepID=A0A1Q2YB42_9ASCO|nr:hypothetical protein PMKS-000208 [Pichia membranifaciens]
MFANMKFVVLALLLHFNLVTAKLLGTTIRQGSGISELNTCRVGVAKLTFDYKMLGRSAYSKFWDAPCGYPPSIGTFLLCTYEISGNNTSLQPSIFKTFAKRCHDYSSYDYPVSYYEEQFKNATENYVPLSQLNSSLPIYSATLPKMKLLLETYENSKATDYNVDASTWFAVAVCGYFLLLIAISALYNFSRRFGFTKRINGSKLSKLFQKYLIFPTLLPNGSFSQNYCYRFFTMLFPNRIQFVTDFFLFGLQVAFYCAPYKYIEKGYWVAYVGYRSGIMSLGKIPLLILFAGRNNFLLWVTGWSYSTFLHFHKVVAGWMFIDALIHSVAYTIDYRGFYVNSLQYTYFACGIAATVFAGVLCLHSLHVFRRGFYEYFLAIHVVLALCLIVMVWHHCNILGWMEWLVAACCVWFFDRLVRAIRMFAFGYKTATITVIGDQLMKVEVPKPAWWIHGPGTYGFIYFSGIIFWENHPFTVVVEDGKICAYIKVKMGVTSRIWNKLIKNNNKMTWRICIEGPYGGELTPMLKKYDDALFLAGGSGAPAILEGATKATNGKLFWVAQQMIFVTAYQTLIEKINIPIDIYITRETSVDRTYSKRQLLSDSELDSQSTDSSDKETSDKETDNNVSQIRVCYGRPDINEIIETEIRASNAKNVGIIACGPPIMMDNIRHVITNHVTDWDKGIDFFDEFQIW